MWALLTLIHLARKNIQQADECFRFTLSHAQTLKMSDELILEIGLAYLEEVEYANAPYRAEAAARMALRRIFCAAARMALCVGCFVPRPRRGWRCVV